MSRRFVFALLMTAIAMQSTGCCILRNVVYRIRTNHGCGPVGCGPVGCGPVGCAPGFGVGYSGDAYGSGYAGGYAPVAPIFAGPVGAPAVGGPGCASCYKPGVDGYAAAPPAGNFAPPPEMNFSKPPSMPYNGGNTAPMTGGVPVYAGPGGSRAPVPTQMPSAEPPMRPKN